MDKKTKKKLEIGCGNKPTPGYTHLDIRDLPHVDIIDDAETLEKIEDESCDKILAVQVLEHFSHKKTLNILKLWYSKLKSDGELELEVPDLKLFCTLWVNGFVKEPWAFISIFGGQNYPENTHKAGFTKNYLASLLKTVGFKQVIDLMWMKPNKNCELKIIAKK